MYPTNINFSASTLFSFIKSKKSIIDINEFRKIFRANIIAIVQIVEEFSENVTKYLIVSYIYHFNNI
jgi:hypothetical protein